MPDAREDHPRNAEYAALRDADLIVAMRRDEQRAFVEFIERFRLVAWTHARDLGVASAERKSWTEEVLHDCALALVREGARIPGNIAGYVVVSVRRRFFKQYQKAREEARMSDELARELSSISSGNGDVVPPLPPAVRRLVDALAATLSEEEELLLVWKGHRITYGTIAEWLGESRSAVAQRIWRLTRRMTETTERIIESLDVRDRETIRRFIDSGEENRE